MRRPALFVGSSSEGQRVAESLQVILDPVCEVELWTQGIFGLTQGTLESLVVALSRFDFALLILTADDLTVSRGVEKPAARDNVLFELGLFIGSLGRERTFMLYDRTKPPMLPSDMAGITAATFAPHVSGNLEAALGAPCTRIRNAIERLGVRSDNDLRTHGNAVPRSESRSDSFFRTAFPGDLISRRASATDLLLIGLTMTRTVQAGSLVDMRRILQSGGKIRILVVDPTNDELVAAVSRNAHYGITSAHVRRRIEGTLEELTELHNSTDGELEVRIASSIPAMGFNVIDVNTTDGLIVAQHYEHRPTAEAAPIFCLKPTDGIWYERFAAEALRLWEDGTPWPLSADQELARSPRPRFQDTFGPGLESAMKLAHDLLITGVTRNTLITSNYSKFEEWLQRGCRIRVILMDPSSEAVATAADRYYVERSPDIVRERIRHTMRLLTELKRSTGGSISVRLTTHPLAVGAIVVDGAETVRSNVSALFIEYYTYQARGEPKFVLQPSDGAWFENFLGEAEALWANAIEAPPTGYLTRPRGGRVNRKETVTGTVSYLPSLSQALIVIQTPQDRQLYWPQAVLRLSPEGDFTSEAKFGRAGNRDSGGEFILMLIAASSAAAAASLQSSLEEDNGMTSLPHDVIVLDKVTVIRF